MLGLLSWRWLLGMCMLLVMCITIVWCLWYFFDPDSPRQKENEIERYWSDAALRTWATKYVSNNQELRRDYNQTSAQRVVDKSKKSPKKSPYTTASTAASETDYAPSMDDLIKSVFLKSKQCRLPKAVGSRNTRLR
jgi:hypothetical protein